MPIFLTLLAIMIAATLVTGLPALTEFVRAMLRTLETLIAVALIFALLILVLAAVAVHGLLGGA